MTETTTADVTYRAVARDEFGATMRPARENLDDAIDDARSLDRALTDAKVSYPYRLVIEMTTTTTTTTTEEVKF